MTTKYCIWLCDDHKLSSLFPSYLLKAFHIPATYTTNIHEANLILGGRNLLRVPEHYSGIIFGAGLDRKIIRSFPLMKIINLLGHKSSECVLSSSGAQGIVGDPLLLSDIVYTRLQQTPGVLLGTNSAPPLFFLQSTEDLETCRQWKWIKQAEDSKELVLQCVTHLNQSMLEVMELIASSKYVFSNDPDVIAIALSFNVACCPITLKSADIFVWKDLFSAFPQQQAPTVKRIKDDTTLKEAISWCQTRAVGELKVLKGNILQQLEKLRGVSKATTSKPRVSPRDTLAAVPKKSAPKRSKSLSRLSQTQVFQPAHASSAAPSRKSADEITRLRPTWVKQKLATPSLPPLPLNSIPTSTSSSSTSFSTLLSTTKTTPRSNNLNLPPPLPATLLTEDEQKNSTSSAASTPHIRNRNSRKMISNETPRD